MKSKTCGECETYDHYHLLCVIGGDIKPTERAKDCFVSANPTNGDKIIAGGIKALVKFHLLGTCDTCIYYNKEHASHKDICLCPKDKTCADGIEGWLNAPADACVKQNGNHDTQPDLCVADKTESEGENETE